MFHGEHSPRVTRKIKEIGIATLLGLPDTERGFFLGLLVAHGHFGGDGRQAQVSIKLHVRHEAMLRRLAGLVAGSRLYGPYHHGGREYFQLMFRGVALRDSIVPLLESIEWRTIDPYVHERYERMKARYALDPQLQMVG